MSNQFPTLHIVDHPLVQHKLSVMRDKNTSVKDFRALVGEIAMLLTYEATRDLPMTTRTIETPICPFEAPVLAGKKLAIVPILRAGLGFEDGILGHKAGDEFEIHVTFPERYRAKDLAGKAVVFKIKLHDVCVRQLPSMNSDFAKKVGGVDTMEEFREKVRKQLYDGRHGGALNHAKDQVLAKLADAAEGELPSVLVESTYQQEMQNVQQQLQMQRMTLNSYLSQIHETRESFTAKLHAGAEKNTRARMALLQIAQQENLVPTDEEIDKMIAERAERTKKTVEEIREKTNIPALKRAEAIRRAADWVIERSTIEEK